MKPTNVFASDGERESIKQQWNEACNAPVMTFSTNMPDMASVARRCVMESIDRLAIKHGLKPMDKFYSFDLRSGEFMIAEEGETN